MPWKASFLPGEVLNDYTLLKPDWRWASALEHLPGGTAPQSSEDKGVVEILQCLKPPGTAASAFRPGVYNARSWYVSMAYIIHLRGGPECDEKIGRAHV